MRLAHLNDRPATREEIVKHLRDSDRTGDADFVQNMIDHVMEHDDWALTMIDPKEFSFNRETLGLDEYREDRSPVFVQDGFIQDGSHRASAAVEYGYSIPAYVRSRA